MADHEKVGLRRDVKKATQKDLISLSNIPIGKVSEESSSDLKFKQTSLKDPDHAKYATGLSRHKYRYDPEVSAKLCRAVHSGDIDRARILLEKGADPNEFDVLSDAIQHGKVDMVRLLLEKGADPNKNEALGHALFDDHENIVNLLLEKGAERNTVRGFELRYAAMKGDLPTVRSLLDNGKDEMMFDALEKASYGGHAQIVKMLLDKGADPNKFDALEKASHKGHTDIVEMLLDKGADPNQFDALEKATHGGHTDIVEMLLDKGADPNKFDPLGRASREGHTDIVKMLLDKGADPNKSGALGRASRGGHTDIVKMLLDKGADPNKDLAMQVAEKQGYKDIVDILKNWQYKQLQKTQTNLLDDREVAPDAELDAAMATSSISHASGDDAMWLMKVIKEGNEHEFKKLEKTMTTANEDSWAILLHSVAVYGTAQMVERMQSWNGIKWDKQYTFSRNRFGGVLDAITVEKATTLFIATFLDRTEVAELLVQYAGEDNIKCCFQNLRLSNKMEQVFMLELGKRLKQQHHELQPAIVPGHMHRENDIRRRVFVVYSPSVVQASDYDFNGLALVKLRNPYVIRKSAVFEPDVKTTVRDNDIDKIKKAINIHRRVLWSKHSNLNIITGSAIIYHRNEADIEKRSCVVLYCSTKGVIPLGEERFPRQLPIENEDYIDIDIREGFFEYGVYQTQGSADLHQSLKMGCNIGRLTPQYVAHGHPLPNLSGTLGPFVRYTNNLGFLTCAHVLFDIPSPTHTLDFTASASNLVEVVQPSTDSTSYQGGAACGIVERAIFDHTRDPSVDAAVVRLTDPSRVPTAGQFSNELISSYRNAGFNEMPEYNSGAMRTIAQVNDLSSTQTVVKFGSKTDVTRGALRVFDVAVRPLTTVLGLPRDVGDVEMKNQYQIIGIHPSANFVEKGDSGSGVFCKDLTGVLHCIGMAIGSANVSDYQYRAGIVTPIDAVLHALGPNLDLATFP